MKGGEERDDEGGAEGNGGEGRKSPALPTLKLDSPENVHSTMHLALFRLFRHLSAVSAQNTGVIIPQS
jgi:hypothetical protein